MPASRTAALAQPAESRRPRLSLLQASCWLAVLLVIAKAASADREWLPHPVDRLLAIIASSSADVLFALSCGAVGDLGLLAFRKQTRGAKVLRAIFLAWLTACAVYAVAAVGLFHYFNRPLTYDLLGLVGNAATIRSSILARLTWPTAIALIAAPALFLLLALKGPRSRKAAIIAISCALVWTIAGAVLHRFGHDQEQLEYLWLSPHAELLRSTFVRLTGGARPAFPHDFPKEFQDEFRTFAARSTPASDHFHAPPGVARPRNVIVVVLESVGSKYLGRHGTIDVTPNLTAAAENAIVFDQIYAQASFTYASFRPINFSVYPGLPWHYALLSDQPPLPPTLGSLLRARGARTAFITSGDLDWADQRWLLERSGSVDALKGAADLGCPLQSSWGTDDRCAFDRLLSWIDERPNESFVGVVWTDQTHDPYFPVAGAGPIAFDPGATPPRFAADLARYLRNLHETDAQIGRMLGALRERGLADDTLVVITGDHGEAFGDPHHQRGHAWSVYDEEVRVPLMFWSPRLFPSPRVAHTIGGHVDLNPTIADLLDLPPAGAWQGHSLFDPAHPQRAYFFAIAGGDLFGVREGDWKYVYDVTSGRESLFQLAADPNEQRNLAPEETARCLQLRQRVAAWVTFEDGYLWGRDR